MRILRLKDVIQTTGLSRSTIYARMALNSFPQSVSLGGASIGWVESEVIDWIEQRVEERNQHQGCGQ